MHTLTQLTNTHHLAAFGWRPVVNGVDTFADPEHCAAELEARDKSAAWCRAVKSLATIRQMGKMSQTPSPDLKQACVYEGVA